MKDKILRYIAAVNKYADISIEYAILEPFTNNINTQYNLHIVYTPKLDYLLQSYVSGVCSDVLREQKLSVNEAHSFFVAHCITPEVQFVDIADIKNIVVSNLARFYNFKFDSSTDPFLSMFLEEENIIWKTTTFDECFFSKKSTFQLSRTIMATATITAIQKILATSREYNYYSNSSKMLSLHSDLINVMKLYFITQQYIETGNLTATLSITNELILNTLGIAAKPWDYAIECSKKLETYVALNSHGGGMESFKELLKTHALNFLSYKIRDEVTTTNNITEELTCATVL